MGKLKEFRKEKKAARKAKRAAKKEAKADMLKGGSSRKEMRQAKRAARKSFKAKKKDLKKKHNVKEVRKERRKKAGKVIRAGAAVATGGKSELAIGAAKGIKKGVKKLKDKKTAKKSAATAKANASKAKMRSKIGDAKKAIVARGKRTAAEKKAKSESRASSSSEKKQSMALAMYGKGPHMGDSSRLTGAGSEGTPGLGRMSMSPQPGMYGRGSKISYGNYSAPKMGSYAKHGGKGSPSMHKMPSFIKGKKK